MSEIVFLSGSFFSGLFAFAHCSLMCGPIVMLFAAHPVSYQAGRFTGYTLTGAILGSAGYLLNEAGLLVRFQNVALILSITFLILFAAGSIFFSQAKAPSWMLAPTRWIAKLKQSSGIPSFIAVYFAGVFSALIPCAVLFPLWALAAGSGSALYGASLAFAFVLGTIPALTGIQLLTQKGFSLFKGKLKYVSTLLMLLTAGGMMIYRSYIAPPLNLDLSSDVQCIDPASNHGK